MADERLLPPGIRDERSLAYLQLLDRLDALDLTKLLIYHIDTVEASALPHLGWQFHVMGAEGWQLATGEAQKRALIRRALELHRYKGTRWAVIQALAGLGVTAELVEWWQAAATGFNLQPYEFGLLAHITRPLDRAAFIGQSSFADIQATLDSYKNTRSHLGWFAFVLDVDLPINAITLQDKRYSTNHVALSLDWRRRFDVIAGDAQILDDDEPLIDRRLVNDRTLVICPARADTRLDRLPVFDAVPCDFAPLDTALETALA